MHSENFPWTLHSSELSSADHSLFSSYNIQPFSTADPVRGWGISIRAYISVRTNILFSMLPPLLLWGRGGLNKEDGQRKKKNDRQAFALISGWKTSFGTFSPYRFTCFQTYFITNILMFNIYERKKVACIYIYIYIYVDRDLSSFRRSSPLYFVMVEEILLKGGKRW